MDNVFHDPAFQAYTLSVAVLVITLYGLGFHTARLRAARKIVINHEDVGINGGAQVADVEHADVLRVKRAHLNLLENVVPFFAIGLLYLLTEPSVNFARALFAIFVAIRVFHAVFYLAAKQPFRTISFVIGALVNLTMTVQVLRAVVPAMT